MRQFVKLTDCSSITIFLESQPVLSKGHKTMLAMVRTYRATNAEIITKEMSACFAKIIHRDSLIYDLIQKEKKLKFNTKLCYIAKIQLFINIQDLMLTDTCIKQIDEWIEHLYLGLGINST